MDRREMLFGVGAAVMTRSAISALGEDASAHHHEGGTRYQSLIDSASKCSTTAEICVGHCIDMLAAGDKSLAACAASTREVMVVCDGLRALAAQNAAHLAMYAKVTAEFCKSCEAECRKHPQHQVCVNCGNACAACAAECQKVV